ncbi:MAG TPA: efflux RND transporter periplasmic adaptor subunit [Steroidobacteraceae bacterium]|jgi:HlyD family secretion protein
MSLRFGNTAAQDRTLEPVTGWRRHIRLGLAGFGALLLLAALIAGVHHFAGAIGSIDRGRLSIATVERGSFVRDITADGQVVAAVSPTLYAGAAGSVTLKVHAGDGVTRGQLLAQIDSPDLSARLSQEQASLTSARNDWQHAQREAQQKVLTLKTAFEQARVDQDTAQRELERSRKAYELGAYSELQALRAQDALEKAQFAYQQARQTLEAQPQQNRFDIDAKQALLARQQLLVADLTRQVAELAVRSPVDGQIGQVQVADRATVARDAPLLTVVDLSALEVEIKVPESFAHELTPGMNADLQGDGRHWPGTVSGVSPEVVAGQVTARLRFGAAKPAGLRQNQRLSVRILLDRRDDVLMVERGAFMDQDGGTSAYVVDGNVAQRRPVRLGASSLQKVEILDGLAAGDRIVISGSDVFNGAERVILSR